jgi:hypothetical protein
MARLLEAARERNEAIASSYKSASKRLLSRSMSSMAAAAADQRKELGNDLSEIAAGLDASLACMAFALPDDLVSQATMPIPETEDAARLFGFFRDIEEADRKLYALVADLVGKANPDLASRLENFAELARKRAALAADHLDLLSLGGGRA